MDEELRKLDRLAWWMDAAFKVPGTKWRVGLDGLIGLIPGIGDLIAGGASAWIVAHAVRLGLPWHVVIRMAGNVALESLVGTIPVIGDLFDMGYKANQRNVAIMREAIEAGAIGTPRSFPTSARRGAAVVAVGLLVLAAIVVGLVALGLALVIGALGLFA
ncbi:DUF4112 domain-containing protein [Nitrogeniibacter aestuarii]|uniref:DUF4112 domain-containing protein n=1 Tax=Nitrogeniibacter aestuarii TaxID=2815343 RepID=UPI001D10ADA0|nr:DUF4112 domain-containing protein [Nitrogeniibacter aestuarii]